MGSSDLLADECCSLELESPPIEVSEPWRKVLVVVVEVEGLGGLRSMLSQRKVAKSEEKFTTAKFLHKIIR
jgi:hypothetical protein